MYLCNVIIYIHILLERIPNLVIPTKRWIDWRITDKLKKCFKSIIVALIACHFSFCKIVNYFILFFSILNFLKFQERKTCQLPPTQHYTTPKQKKPETNFSFSLFQSPREIRNSLLLLLLLLSRPCLFHAPDSHQALPKIWFF